MELLKSFKKKVFSLLLVISVLSASFAFSQEGAKTIIVCIPSLQGVDGLMNSYIAIATRFRLQCDMAHYLGYQIADSTNSERLAEVYTRSQSMGTKAEAVETAKAFSAANCALFSVIKKTGKNYSMESELVDLGTMESLAKVGTNQRPSLGQVIGDGNSLVSDVTLALCKKLDKPVSDVSLLALKSGAASLLQDERLALCEERAATFKRQIAEIKKRKIVTEDEDVYIQAQKAMSIERAYLKKLQKQNEEEVERLNKFLADKEADAEKDKERGLDARRIKANVGDAITKALPDKKTPNEPCEALQVMSLLQSKKCALFEIKESVENQCAEIEDTGAADFEKRKNEIEGRPYSDAELDEEGNPSTVAVVQRQSEVERIKNAIDKDVSNKLLTVTSSTKNQIARLKKEIDADIVALKTVRHASSTSGDLRVFFYPFSGENDTWKVDLYLYSEGTLLTKYTTSIGYNDLPNGSGEVVARQIGGNTDSQATSTKKSKAKNTKKDKKSKKGKDDVSAPAPKVVYKNTNPTKFKDFPGYEATVSAFDSLLHQGTPIFNFVMEYSLSSLESATNTQYTLDIKKVQLFDTMSGRQVYSHAVNTKEVIKLNNLHDYRSDEEVARDEAAETTDVDSILDADAVEIEEPEVESVE